VRDEALARQLAYWLKQWGGLRPAPAGAGRGRRVPARITKFERVTFGLPPGASDAVVKLAGRESSTVFMVMLAAFDAALGLHLAQDDIVVSSSLATRSGRETQSLIGLFLNTVLLRTNVGGDPTFRELLARVRKTTLEAHANQDAPFQHVIAALPHAREAGFDARSSIVFGLRREALPAREIAGLTLSRLEVYRGAAKFNLELQIAVGADGIRGTVDFNTDVFQPAVVQALLADLESILRGAAANPLARVRELYAFPQTPASDQPPRA
jgi:non-ribosomal peptide synthetase component F